MEIAEPRQGENMLISLVGKNINFPPPKRRDRDGGKYGNTFACLPRQRALDDAARTMAYKMLEMRGNKKLIQNELMKTSNTRVTLKDLHNLGYTGSGGEPIPKIIQMLKDKDGSIVEMLKSDDDNSLLGIFYQDAEMRKTYDAYPEIFFLDAIYKTNDRRIPLYVMLVEDGNGESEIVGLFVVTVESAAVLTKIASIFKHHNPLWEKTEVILTDKDLVEREAFQNEFRDAKLLICLFHVMQTFRREITKDKRGITQGERDLCLEIIQKMAYAPNEEKYQEYYDQLKDGPKSVHEYFEENWHTIRNQWVICLQQKQGRTCGNRTNNRLESTNQKIMQVVKRHSRLDDMFESLLKLVTSLRIERDCSAAVTQLKKPLNVEITHPAENEYLRLLTSYAFAKIRERFLLINKVKVIEITEDGITVKDTEGTLTVTPSKCTCVFFLSMGLPCHHILQCRKAKDLDLYSTDLVARRWTKSYYLAHSRLQDLYVDTDEDMGKENVHCSILPSKTRPVLSQHQKFRTASLLTTKLASLASESTKHFPQRIKLLQHLVRLWEDNNEAVIVQVERLVDELPVELETSTAAELEVASPATLQVPISSSESELLYKDNFNPEIALSVESNSKTKNIHSPPHEITPSPVLNVQPPNSIPASSQSISSNLKEYSAATLAKPPKKTCIRKNVPSVTTDVLPSTVASKDDLPKLPARIPKRGRPKGFDKTVIGLPSKRAKKKPSPFHLKHPKEKDSMMLQWFVSQADTKKAIGGDLLTEEAVEQNCNKISSACLDKNVSITRLRRYFDEDAWVSVQHVIGVKQKNAVWFCPPCSGAIGNVDSICCNSCLEWFHMDCLHFQSAPKTKNWFCQKCQDGCQ